MRNNGLCQLAPVPRPLRIEYDFGLIAACQLMLRDATLGKGAGTGGRAKRRSHVYRLFVQRALVPHRLAYPG